MRSRSIPLYPAACSNFKQREAQYGARASIFSFLDLHLTQVSTKENFNMATLGYSVTEPALRSPVEEWQPHGKQSESTGCVRNPESERIRNAGKCRLEIVG